MSFKIGDKVTIYDGSWSILIKGTAYNKEGVYGTNKVVGTVIATDCRLPLGRDSWGDEPSPIKGMPLYKGGVMFQDLLVQTEDGFVFTSTRHVKLVEPEKYHITVYGIKLEVTEKQYDEIVKQRVVIDGI